MLGYLFYGIRNLFRVIGNLFRRIGKAPDYVIFSLEGEYPEVWEEPGNFIQRRLRPPKQSLQELADQFRRVSEDPRVKGVVLHLRPLEMEQARLESLRAQILELRKAGKRVVVWSKSYGTTLYFVATAADQILLQPGGGFMALGLSRSYPYLADALERVGVEGDFLQISPYKSAMDMFMRRDMSDEVREMSNWLVESLFNEIIAAMVVGRGISEQEARTLIDSTPCIDLTAVELGLVDAMINEEDLPKYLGQEGNPARIATWEEAKSRLFHRPLIRPGRYVALLTIEGTIMDGESSQPPIKPPVRIPILMESRAGDASVVQAVRKVQKDKRAAAIVVYVNSRGGSATASEAMRSALENIDDGRPFIISMGPVAASGGYYVSMPAQCILAQPSTITGSIGVIMGKIVLGNLLDKLLFGRETISRGENTLIYDTEKPFNEKQRKIVLDGINRSYDRFLDIVSESRGLSREEVDAIGKGRVWTGEQALEHGLVDELGGLDRALIKAREMAGLHERAPVRVIRPGKQKLPPVASPASALEYAMQGVGMFQWGTTMLLCPFSWDQ